MCKKYESISQLISSYAVCLKFLLIALNHFKFDDYNIWPCQFVFFCILICIPCIFILPIEY